jgi:uncharacterized protein YegL/energy-coupling factor transporter ATP-binding protein EcfA2
MALANVAEILYSRGIKVLMVDFDLEAPGLERYFAVDHAVTSYDDVLKHRGVIDMLYSYKELRSLSQSPSLVESLSSVTDEANISLPVEPLQNFVVDIYKSNDLGGTLSLIPAGRRWQEEYQLYAERLRDFDWQDFYVNMEGERFFEWFRQETSGISDIVLIDSRTGITEMGGVCTYQLADVVISFVAPNEENLNGIAMVAESLSNDLVKAVRQKRDISLLFVPSRVDRAEGSLLDKFKAMFEDKLMDLIPTKFELKFKTSPFIDLLIPYVTEYSYLEKVAVREPDRPIARDLINAYINLSSAMIELAPKTSRLYKLYLAPQTPVAEPEMEMAAVSEHTDFVGRQWVFDRIDTWLQAGKPAVLLLTGPPGSGKSAIAAHLAQLTEADAALQRYTLVGPRTLVYAHFCRAIDDRSLSPLRFVTSLSQHLANRFPVFASALLQSSSGGVTIQSSLEVGTVAAGGAVTAVHIEAIQAGALSSIVAFDELVRRPLERLCTQDFDQAILILVDALDEALSFNDTENLVTLLARAADQRSGLPPQVHFLLTCRRDPRVLRRISGATLDLIEDSPSKSDDIRAYVLAQLHILPELERMTLAGRIVDAAQGNFLYATYVVKMILSEPNKIHDLNGLVLPAGLEGAYHSFLKREVDHDPTLWNHIKPFLGLIAEAHGDGLTVTQLAGITGRSQHTTVYQLEFLQQYLHGQLPYGPFRLFDKSFHDFLIQDQDPEIKIYPSEVNESIADFFMEEYRDAWDKCEDQYALRYTLRHLTDALMYSSERSERRKIITKLIKLLTDQSYVKAITKLIGGHALLSDVEKVSQIVSEKIGAESEEGQKLARIQDSLRREMHSKTNQRAFPLFLVIDTSGSMAGEPIERLSISVKKMLDDLLQASSGNIAPLISIISFGNEAREIIPLSPLSPNTPNFKLEVSGATSLGSALHILATRLADDSQLPSQYLPPMIIIFMDGEPTDDWQHGLKILNESKLGKRARRICVAWGDEVNLDVLRAIAGESIISVPDTTNIGGLSRMFTWISSSIRFLSLEETAADSRNLPPPPFANWESLDR